jgi:hypothetical protein
MKRNRKESDTYYSESFAAAVKLYKKTVTKTLHSNAFIE